LTVLAIEDIHWASESLLDLLASLAETLDDAAVVIACPARPELLDRRPDWGAGSPNATALSLGPLSRSESDELVAALLEASRLPDDVRRRVLERAEGNPFFVEEIVRMWIESGALVRQNGGWAAGARLADAPLPDSIHAVIAARLDLLDAAGRDALRRCAVVGRIFWPSAVDVEDDVIVALSRRGLVSERPASTMAGRREFAFKHALTRDVAYAALPRRDRRELHRSVAKWILDASPDREPELAELAAYHYAEAIAYGEDDPDVAGRARALLVAAGEAAIARGALAEATRLLRRALDMNPEDRERASMLLTLGRVSLMANNYSEAFEQLQAARALADSVGERTIVADAGAWISRVHWVRGDPEQMLLEANAAIEALEGLPETPQLARVLARRSQWEMLSSRPEAIEHAREAIQVARRVGDSFAEANARTNLSTALANAGVPPDEGEMRETTELAVKAGALDEAYRAIINFVWSAQPYVHVDVVVQALVAGYELLPSGAHMRSPENFDLYGEFSLAKFVYFPSGRWDEVERLLARGRLTTAHASYHLVWLDTAAGLALRRGDLDAARGWIAELRERALRSTESQRIVPMLCLAVPLAAIEHDRDALRTAVQMLAATDSQWTAPFPSLPIVRALGSADEPELLDRVAAHIASPAGENHAGHARPALAAAYGWLALAEGRAGVAVERLSEALAVEAALGRRYSAACLELDLARAHDAAGDPTAALDARSRAAAFLEPLACVHPY
jgi:tetratricopeptide (TPR) repeat protein